MSNRLLDSGLRCMYTGVCLAVKESCSSLESVLPSRNCREKLALMLSVLFTMCTSTAPYHPSKDEAAIRATEMAYDKAWNAGDVPSLVSIFTEEAMIVNPLGKIAKGRTEIKRVIGNFLSGPASGSTHTSIISRVEFITEDVAVVDGEAILAGMRSSDGSPSPPLVHKFTDIMIRQDNRWLISQVRAYIFMQELPAAEH